MNRKKKKTFSSELFAKYVETCVDIRPDLSRNARTYCKRLHGHTS